jgi:hypothetical protein
MNRCKTINSDCDGEERWVIGRLDNSSRCDNIKSDSHFCSDDLAKGYHFGELVLERYLSSEQERE